MDSGASDDIQKSPKNRKRSSEQISYDQEPQLVKKAKLFSVKQFRKQLQTSDKVTGLKEFSSVLTGDLKHKFILDYLKDGGNCLELIQILENDSTISPSLIFDLLAQILLEISSKYGDYFTSAHESCRYLINNYLPVIHKMLGLSSSKEERKACLKLLTAMATFSSNLAKDILLNVKFHTANIELLTKHTGEKNSVRDSFIHFITAFLIDSDWHTLSVLLEKSGLLTSIIAGLQYDEADTVCVVITAMKNHILENSSVSKTTKMHVFNTAVVKDIVNLYNWKGLEGLKTLDKNHKTFVEVNKLDKSKVSECVHDFLLVLCTSYKYGLIFSDHMVGLGRKSLNGLMYTVLDSLDKPWQHSYASDLVIKICRSCPDLTKNMWLILKPYLEPRPTEKWFTCMLFAAKLVDEMEPSCLDYCSNNLLPHQLAQVIEILISPSPILQLLLSEPASVENHDLTVTTHIMKFLVHMLKKMSQYIGYLKNWTSADDISKITFYLSNYVAKHYPKPNKMFDNWNKICLPENEHDNKELRQEILHVILDILSLYKTIAPQLLTNLEAGGFDFKDFLLKISSYSKGEINTREALQIKIISIFVDIDQSFFMPKSDIFSYIVPILLRHFYETKNRDMQKILFKLLRNTGIFESNPHEINIWLNGIFNCSKLTDNLVNTFIQVIKNTDENLLEYQKELSQIKCEDNLTTNDNNLEDYILNISDTFEFSDSKIRYRNFSPAVLGFLKLLSINEHSKTCNKYGEYVLLHIFYNETNWQKFVTIIQKYSDAISSNVFNYISNWQEGQVSSIPKIKGSLTVFNEITERFLNNLFSVEIFKNNVNLYPDFLVDALRITTFYFTNLISNKTVLEQHCKNWEFVIEYFIQNNLEILDPYCLDLILANPLLIETFFIDTLQKNSASNVSTRASLNIFSLIQKTGLNIERYKGNYSGKMYQNILKVLKHSKKRNNQADISDYLAIFSLNYQQCIRIIDEICRLPVETFSEKNSFVVNMLNYSLEKIVALCKLDTNLNCLDEHLVSKLTSLLTIFNKENKPNSFLSANLRQYFEIFPHNIVNIDPDLFQSILNVSEYNKENADLAVALLNKDYKLVKEIEDNVSLVCDKKGLILPIVHVLISNNASDSVLANIYKELEPSILKAIQKPQKVGQHFLKDYNISYLIEKYMSFETLKEMSESFAGKVQKFEVVEVFHAKLLESFYSKLLLEIDTSQKQFNNIIMTFVHLLNAAFKKKIESPDEINKVNTLGEVFIRLLKKIKLKTDQVEFAVAEPFKLFCKFVLKYGVSEQSGLLTVLRWLIKLTSNCLTKDDASNLMDMLLSHSEFLNVVLGDAGATKLEVLTLFFVICETWNELMEKSHMAVLLSAYRGMVTSCDRTLLMLFKLYESKPEQTRFYDFKPFLCGRAAAAHYSVRTQIGATLNRQPKISDVLDILKEDLVKSTITNYPLEDGLEQDKEVTTKNLNCYDLKFFLPLFSHILAPEQQVKTYTFIRSGALSLTVLGLACQSKEVRQAASHVLARLHFHLEARQTGKDNVLWIRYVEALCKGVAVLPNFKLNSFAAIFFARMVIILTNPKHIMFPPLSAYLTAKQDLDLSAIPELYTLLFSSDVNFKEHRTFILEILIDGLKTEKDFLYCLKSMAFKLISELYSSCISNFECKLLILKVLDASCRLPLAVRMLTENYSLMSQLSLIVADCVTSGNKFDGLPILLKIFLNILNVNKSNKYVNETILDCCQIIMESDSYHQLKDKDIEHFYEVLYKAVCINNSTTKLNKNDFINKLTERVIDRFCAHAIKYGCRFVTESGIEEGKLYYLRMLVYKLLS